MLTLFRLLDASLSKFVPYCVGHLDIGRLYFPL
jgi:hypothetical protein